MNQQHQTHRQSRKTALCGMMAALSVVILCLGGLIPLATFACPMLAMMCLIPAVCEYGQGTPLLLYGAAAMVAALLALGNVTFLVFDQALARITTLYQKKSSGMKTIGD